MGPNFNPIYEYLSIIRILLILALINLLRAKSFIIVIEGTILVLKNISFAGKGGLVLLFGYLDIESWNSVNFFLKIQCLEH